MQRVAGANVSTGGLVLTKTVTALKTTSPLVGALAPATPRVEEFFTSSSFHLPQNVCLVGF